VVAAVAVVAVVVVVVVVLMVVVLLPTNIFFMTPLFSWIYHQTRGSTVVYATHIFDGLDDWPSHLHYITHDGEEEGSSSCSKFIVEREEGK